MNEDQIKNLEAKIDIIGADVKKMKSYFLWTFWVTIALFVLPLLGLLFAVPKFFSTYSEISNLGL
jgi:hypothetical protein